MITYDAIPGEVWAKLSGAADDPAQRLRLMAVATVTPEERPSNRTLVLRGADRTTGLVWFHTDRRSPKLRHLEARPYVSALAYDEHDDVQVRLDGPVSLHFDDRLADHHWEQVGMAVRYAYGLPHGPGEPLRQPDPRFQELHRQQKQGELHQGRENFGVIQVRVETIDWLQVGATGQVRAVLRASSGWKAEPLVP
jgi:pyridoxamine 5'-phosphate oxidase